MLLKREGRPPLPIRANGAPSDHLHGAEAPEDAPITFHGQMPLWVCYQHNFYPVQTGLYPSLVHNLIYERPVVPQEEISEFLDRVWTRLPSSELYEPQQFLRMMEPVFQPATYNPKLFLDEEGSLLTLEIDNIYQTRHGEFTLNGPNPDFQTGSYTYEGQTYLVRRHQEEEAQLMNELAGMDFQARSSKLWFLEPEEAIAFLLDSYPTLVENYRVYGERALSRYKMRTAKSSISAEVVSNEKEKWFSLEISVDYEGQSLPLDKIWKAWTRGKRYVQLKDGSYTSLPESWLEKIAHKLTALGLDPSKPPQTKFKQFEAPVLDSLLEDLPGARTDSFWNNLREKIRSFREVRPVPPPKALQANLRSYQLQGLSYLNFLSEYGFGGILADEMGLGKTVQTLAFIQHMVESRFEQVDRFNNSPDIPIFLISLKAGGTGLNLTSADYVIHYDPWWNPAVESQATDRTHRIGQTRQVFSYKLICQNTVEEKILKLQEAKRGVAEAIIPGQDTWKSLTREDLEMLFEV